MSSKATKKRFVTKKQLMELVLPSEIEKVAQVTASRGNNLLEVEDETGGKYLASMPTRFRNTVWVKRGHFVLLEPIEEGDKVRAEISHVLDTENILYIRDEGLWPKKFDADAEAMTRHSKRGVEASVNIDPDMLPPKKEASITEEHITA
ncbi:translation initiation factor 1A / IF-1 domain-containing protein [Ditylenchus destructor]|nr:translation initiation factor 1A / IF-1 domain-containing protein [Ditylenchus destructor]